jgi:hypothetical protein
MTTTRPTVTLSIMKGREKTRIHSATDSPARTVYKNNPRSND